jgi:hypothetical protein
MDEFKSFEYDGVVTPFQRQRRTRTHTIEAGVGVENPRPMHAVQAYLEMLRDEEFVSLAEYEKLQEAFTPLMRKYPYVRPAAVRAVRNEMGRPENNKYVLRDKEETFWKNVRRRGAEVPIPGFAPEELLQRFHVTPHTDPDQTVVFLRPEFEKPVSPYIPPSLRMGEVFFYVVLRIFRRHLERYER